MRGFRRSAKAAECRGVTFVVRGDRSRSIFARRLGSAWQRVGLAVMVLSVAALAQRDAHALIEHSVHVVTADWNASPEHECFERDQEPKDGSRTFDDLMLIGSPYQRLVGVNDKPLFRTSGGRARAPVARYHQETTEGVEGGGYSESQSTISCANVIILYCHS